MVSLSEHAQIIKELGMSSSSSGSGSGGGIETIKVQHVFLFTMNDTLSQRWEKLLSEISNGWLNLGRQAAKALLPSIHVLLAATSAYLILCGISQVIASIQSSSSSSRTDNEEEKATGGRN